MTDIETDVERAERVARGLELNAIAVWLELLTHASVSGHLSLSIQKTAHNQQ